MKALGNYMKSESESRPVVSDFLWSHGQYSPWNSPGQNTRMGSFSVLQGIFPTQGSNPGLWHCWQILYQMSHKGSPRILEWVAYPFSRGCSWPRNRTRVSCLAGGFFTNWTIREALSSPWSSSNAEIQGGLHRRIGVRLERSEPNGQKDTILTMSPLPAFLHWKRPWCWQRLKAKGEAGGRKPDD